MKKFINSVDTMLAESLDGFAAAHADIVVLGPSASSCGAARSIRARSR